MNQITQTLKGNVPVAQHNSILHSFRKRLGAMLLLAALVMVGGKVWGQVTWSGTISDNSGGGFIHYTSGTVITVTGDVYLKAPLLVWSGQNITIQSDGVSTHTIYMHSSFSHINGGNAMFFIGWTGSIGALTINGGDKLIIDAGGTGYGSRMCFNILAGSACTINNTTIKDGFYGSGGGAAVNSGSLTCTDCIFGDNTSGGTQLIGAFGGAIRNNSGAYLTCTSCKFYRGLANSGGAIYNEGTTYIYGGTFENNTTNGSINDDRGHGGAIVNTSSGVLNVSQATSFKNNVATVYGGAIYNNSGAAPLSSYFNGCTFEGNQAVRGGGIYNNSTMQIIDCVFDSNSTSGTANGNFGGGIINDHNGTLSCTSNCEFKSNEAFVGGGICSYGKVTVQDCVFDSNKASGSGGGNGGGFYQSYESNSNPSVITSCEFKNNQANAGGAIFSSGYLKITEANGNPTKIHDNEILSGGTGGGGIFTNGTIDMEAGTIYSNATNIPNGGGVYVALIVYSGDFRLKGSSAIYSNSATGYGGGVFVSSGATFTMSGSSNIGTLGGNSATRGGGIYSEGTVYINGGQIVNNTSSGNGGGVYVNNGTCAITGGTIGTSGNPNTATTNGGGIYIASSGTVYIDGGSIQYNTASTNGGGVYQNGTMNVEGLIVIENNTKSSAANNVYLNTNKLVTINTNGLECGSHIGINNSTADLQVVTGPVAKVQHAYRNGFFFQDANTYGVFPSTTNTFAPASTNLYLANLTGGAINTFPLATGAVAGTDYVGSAGGNITQVKTVKGMAFLAKDVFNGNTYSGKTVTLANDITFGSGDYWEPIGFRAFSSDDCNSNDADHPFSGTFNGNGHIITNLQGNLGYRDFGLFGYVLNGTIQNVIIASGTGGKAAENLGGLVGFQNGGQIQYCQVILTSLTGESGATKAIGGIVGRLASAKLHSCSAIPGTLSNGTARGGLVGVVASGGKLYNSYANTNLPAFGSNSGDVQNCYVRNTSGTGTYYASSSSNGTFTAVQTPYLYRHADNQVTIGGATTNLVDKLNSWSNSYPKWTRTMASPINDDYPILMLSNTTCVGTKSGSSVLNYGTSLNTMLGSHNASGDNIYFWGTESGISNGNGSANVYFAENAAITHTSTITNAHVGITLDNTNGSAGVHWHMFSPALSNAPLGINYNNDNTQWPFSLTHPSGMPYYLFTQKSESNSTYGYFPSHLFGQSYPANNTSLTGSNAGNYYNDWDYYCYLESQYHWINFKRNSESHYHEDGNHDPISYNNESTMTRGKGYLVATTYSTLLEAKGTLNQGSFTIPVTRNGEYRTGYNFLGNPYQSYFDFDRFADVNKALWGGTKTNASYLILDKDGYTYYAYSGSTNLITSSANRYLHPHQGFMIVATVAGNASFDNSMRNITATVPFRDDHIDYPLVNLIATEEDGNRDIVTVELGRPEVGGAFKQYDMHLGKGCIYTHYEDQDYAIAFTLPGLSEIGIRFETDEDATYTMTWDMENGEFSYLHLIDNITGSDIDCLRETEYRFTSRTNDYKSRFKLVFEYTGIEEQEDGPSTGSGTFAFMMGDELVVNCGPSTGSGTAGTATLQMFDMMGRLVMQKTVSGTQTTIAMPEMTAGVYVLRLSDNNGSRVQKIVIE